MNLKDIIGDEALRKREFPVVSERVFLAHAGVAPLTRRAAEAICLFAESGCRDQQESPAVWEQVREARRLAARLIGAEPQEVALLGPTSLGLNLVANGLPWEAGDEVVCYRDDYPANVYPWQKLETSGVRVIFLEPEYPGVITWELIESVLTERTRLVALATCNFLSGYRINIEQIGQGLHKRGILFSLDGIQTLGAFPTSVEHVDFLSADSHKWMLGPVGAGIFYVSREHWDNLRPSLLGSWNVLSPEFVAQEEIQFYTGARRYEPGTLNVPGIVGMKASLELLLEVGIEAIAARLLDLRKHLLNGLREAGYEHCLEQHDLGANADDSERSGIITVRHPTAEMGMVHSALTRKGISTSLRQNRAGEKFVRLSPHFHNSEAELNTAIEVMAQESAG
ncbi:MAG: aminotransferase class V-fold PLP-dependent enzyme [Verrucomicrobia bacterium]|nr:aminotransferase class V-fold PLP-dependent enzyme [Verrucomicrobiota bacterium]